MITNAAVHFGCGFANDFYQHTQGRPLGEIGMFRAMMDSLTCAGNAGAGVATAEFHGARSRVGFTTSGRFSHTKKPHCELADVMAVAYSPSRRCARLTFIQAKYERTVAMTPNLPGSRLRADLIQWDLLSRRPLITAVHKGFTPPPDLLSTALLPSVGSFAFFLPNGANGCDIYYASAHVLRMGGKYTQQKGSVVATGGSCVKTQFGCEAHSLLGAVDFGVALASLAIGTPIGPGAGVPRVTTAWVAQQVRAVRLALPRTPADAHLELALDLERFLAPGAEHDDPRHLAKPAFGARSLLILKVADEIRT